VAIDHFHGLQAQILTKSNSCENKITFKNGIFGR